LAQRHQRAARTDPGPAAALRIALARHGHRHPGGRRRTRPGADPEGPALAAGGNTVAATRRYAALIRPTRARALEAWSLRARRRLPWPAGPGRAAPPPSTP